MPSPAYITETDVFDRSKTMHNTRTGEVIPAGSDEANGKVWTDHTGAVRGRAYDDHGAPRTYRSVDEAVADVARR